MKKKRKLVYFDDQNGHVRCKFSLLTPALRQQLMLVLFFIKLWRKHVFKLIRVLFSLGRFLKKLINEFLVFFQAKCVI